MRTVKSVLLYSILILLSIIFILPTYWVIVSSLKSGSDLFDWPPAMFPTGITLVNFKEALHTGNFPLYFWNSTLITSSSTMITLIISCMAAYAFAKFRFKGDTVLFIIVLCAIMIPVEVVMVPVFKVLVKFKMYNTLLGMIIPPTATPTGMFILRQYLLSVPDELLQASRIDGASEWCIFTRIIIPIARPALAVLAIFSFMWRWNDYLWPLLVASTEKLFTIQLAIGNFVGENVIQWGELLAMSVVSMIPVLIIFLLFQKEFVKGVAMSGLKG